MSKNKYLLIIVLLGMITLASAQVDTLWTRTYTSVGANADYAYVMTADGAGNAYVAGSTDDDLQVIKYNGAGTVLWTYVYSTGTVSERASGIVVAPSGNVYISGYTMGYNSGDYLTIKINGTTGDSIWTRTYDGPGTGGYDFARRVAIDASENVYITGYSSGGTGMGTSDYATVKYDVNGNFQWASRYDGGVAQTDQTYAIYVDANGVYVTGYSNPYAAQSDHDIVTIKYNPTNGDTVWLRRFNGASDSTDYGRDIVADASGNVYITGSSISNVTSTDVVTIKYTSTGDTAWVRRYSNPDTTGGDVGWWIEYDPTGYVYVYGNTSSDSAGGRQNFLLIKYDASTGDTAWARQYDGPNVYELCPDETGQNPLALDAFGNAYIAGVSKSLSAHNLNDMVVVKYNPNGIFQWEARYDNNDTIENAKSVGLDNAGNVYLAGYTYGPGTYIDWATVKFRQTGTSDFIINATAYGPGSIVPSGAVVVSPGADTVFAIIPDASASLDSLIVDGDNHGSDSTSYRFVGVSANHTIKAYFSNNPVTITATAYGPGTIIPSGAVIVPYGGDTTFTITPNLDCQLDSLVVDGTSHGADSTSYKFESVDNDHSIDAYFSSLTPVTYTITATATSGGTITPSGSVIVNQGEDTTFYIAAGSNAVLDSVLVDGISVGAVTSYPFTNVMDNHTIHAMFTITLPPGWAQKESVPQADDIKPGKRVKDGGSLVAVGTDLYAFPGNKSNRFYRYTAGAWITNLDTIAYGYKPLDPTKVNKKKIAKGAALAYAGDTIIYATKGNSTKEFWAYNTVRNQWTFLGFAPVPKALKGGTSLQYHNEFIYLLAGGQKATDKNFFAYDVANDSWIITLPQAITEPDNKPFKDGSSIQILGNTLYALKGKGKHNYFYKYDIAGATWAYNQNETIPLWHHRVHKKTKVGDGGSMTNDGAELYAIKGGGKGDFWKYTPGDPGSWTALDSVPMLTGNKKSVPKTGAALAYANGTVYLLKGNNTPEFWQYNPSSVVTAINPITIAPAMANSVLITNHNFSATSFSKTVRYSVHTSGKASVKLYNSTGSLIKTLSDGYLNAGNYTFNLSNISSGIYFLRYENNNTTSEVKVVIQ